MTRSSRSTTASLLPVALAVLVLSGCSRSGSPPPPGAAAPTGPTGPSGAHATGDLPPQPPAPLAAPLTTPSVAAELGTLELPELEPAAGQEAPEVESFVNREGTAGAFVIRQGGKARLLRGRTLGAPHQNIQAVVIGPDGRRTAYVATGDGKARLVLDGKAGEPFDAIDALTFTRDGRHVAYRAKRGTAWHVGLDGRLGPPQFQLGEPRPAPTGTGVISVERAADKGPFVIARYDAPMRRQVVKEFQSAQLMLSEDGASGAALLLSGKRKQVATFRLATPDTPQVSGSYDEISMAAFDPAGRHAAYAALRSGQAFVVLDGKEEPLPSKTLLSLPLPSPAGGAVAVVLSQEEQNVLHLAFAPDPPRQKRYHSVRDVTFSPDGRHLAYVAEDPGRTLVVVDGREGPAFDMVVSPTFSPDSSHLVFRARTGDDRFVVVAKADGTVLRRHPRYDEVFPVVFPAGGASLAYAVKEKTKLLWLTEKL